MRPLNNILIYFLLCGLLSSCQKESQTNQKIIPSPGGYGPGGPVGPGLNGPVNALTVFNGKLIAGGNFTGATGTRANCIAQWNGTNWASLGSGLSVSNVNNIVSALTVYNGNLIVAGTFTTAGGITVNNIAKWNGTNWSSLGNGFDGPVLALTVYNRNLIASGSFDTLNGGIANFIAQWNDTIWQTVGPRMKYWNNNYSINQLLVSNGTLMVAGAFYLGNYTNSATWNGVQWTNGSLISGSDCSILYNNNIIIGGTFNNVIGTDTACGIEQWNGSSWAVMGTQSLHGGYGGLSVLSLYNYNGNLVVGGLFYYSGNIPTSGLTEWNGSSWSNPFGAGIVYNPPYSMGGPGVVNAITIYNGSLIIGGGFSQVTNTLGASNIAQWDGSKWSAL